MQLSLLAEDTAAAPAGFEYHPEFLSTPEQAPLLARIDAAEWLTDLARRVLHYGYKYDCSNRRVDDSARIGPLPEWLAHLTHQVREAAHRCMERSEDPAPPACLHHVPHRRRPRVRTALSPVCSSSHRSVKCWPCSTRHRPSAQSDDRRFSKLQQQMEILGI